MITVAALVCLIVITMICGALLKIGLAERKIVRSEEHRLQAEWLVEAGLERGAARLKAGDDYTGETWKLSAEDLGGPDPGLVTIAVETSQDHPGRRALNVRAEYPAGSTAPVRQTKRVVLDLGKDAQGDKATFAPRYPGTRSVPATIIMMVDRPIRGATSPVRRADPSRAE
jgi:hypothetical protein